MSDNFKRGALSLAEKDFIRSHIESHDLGWIADRLNRTYSHISKAVESMSITDRVKPEIEAEEREDREILAKLMGRANWKDITKQYTDDELPIVKQHWVRLFRQFKEDITHTEELQIFSLINLQIIIDRNMKERASCYKEVQYLEEQLHREFLKPADERRQDYIDDVKTKLDITRAASKEMNRELMDAKDKQGKVLDALKSTRAQRYKDVENGNKNFFSFMKALSDAKFRQRESREAELYRLAVEKEKVRLSEYHEYEDGEVDRPLLTPETVIQESDD